MGSQVLNIFLQLTKICNFLMFFPLIFVYLRSNNSNTATYILDKTPNQAHGESILFNNQKSI